MTVMLMYQPSEEHFKALQKAAPDTSFLIATDEVSAARQIMNADIVMGNRYFLQSLPYAKKLVWMQSNSSGVDVVLEGGGPAIENVIITSCRGVYDDEVADHALAMILSLFRGIHFARDLQNQKAWERRSLQTLRDKRALILGWGGVGKGIARRLGAFGVEVEGVRRTHSGAPSKDDTEFLVWGIDRWHEALPNQDILILALPKTSETEGLVSYQEMAALRYGAYVVNISRGRILDNEALRELLCNGRLGGCALDVLKDEPPPENHWVWSEKRVIITPHWGRSAESPPFRWESLFEENLRRFVMDEPLLNVVDKDKGY